MNTPNKNQQTKIIEARQLNKYFADNHVLRDIDFNLNQGEVVAITGPSGSGKSTLLHSLAGITAIDGGSIQYNGRDIAKLSQKEKTKLRRNEFGFIFQFTELISELPLRENVALPLLLNGVRKLTANKAARQWLELVKIGHLSKSLPHKISGGELQRVAIARAMAINPNVIFADEPTGSLDSANSKIVMELLIELAARYNKSVVVVTHDSTVAGYAHRVVDLQDGKIIGQSQNQ